MEGYNHKDIEKKWQKKWQEDGLYTVEDEAKTADGSPKENFYTLVEFPYPSGNLHIGHWYAFAVPDIFARFKRMQGYNVLYPIGFDSFGLPAENAAIKRGLDPRKWTYDNMAYMTTQLESMGNMFDWSRKVVTSNEEYYKWTQWFFLELFKKGLAYKKKGLVNWCPSCQTVLANEQILNNECERCGTEVTKKDLEQWFFKTTAYAEELLSGLDMVDWPESIKQSQRNWIGRSEGAEFKFKLKAKSQQLEAITVFTTRADTLFGVTYLVVAPEKVIENLRLKIENWNEVEKYIEEAKKKTEIERTDAKKEKTGVELKGIKAIHPATGEELPVWVADYVLAQYGTGAIMAVPAHDERDFAFAKKYDLPIRQVVVPCAEDVNNPPRPEFKEVKRDTVIVHVYNKATNKYAILNWHGSLEGITTAIMGGVEAGQTPEQAALAEINEEIAVPNAHIIKTVPWITAARYCASHKNQNRCAHTWSFLAEVENLDAQGNISEEEKKIHTLEWINEEDMIVRLVPSHQKQVWNLLHEDSALTASGYLINSEQFNELESHEAREKITEKYGVRKTTYKLRDWLLSRQRYWGCPIPIVYDPEGKPHAVPEKHLPWTLPTDDIDLTPKGTSPLGSSKEFLERTEKIFGKGWRPEIDTMDTFVDSSWYFLRYADPHNMDKPFDKLKVKEWVPVDRYSGGGEHTNMHLLYARFFHKALYDLGLVNEDEPFKNRMNRGLILGPDGQKMSKSKGNVIDPDEFVETVGADTIKTYLAFLGPYNEVGQYPWDLGGIAGVRRFLERVWKLQDVRDDAHQISKETEILLNQTIKKAGEDIEAYKFNTAISQLMILLNAIEKEQKITKDVYEIFLRLLAPFAPHMTEELWEKIGYTTSVHLEAWPQYDESKLISDTVTYAIQINGKTRGVIDVANTLTEEEIIKMSQETQGIKERLTGRVVVNKIFVPGRLINFVVKMD